MKLTHLLVVILSLLAGAQSLRASAPNPLAIPSVGSHELRVLTPTLLELKLVTTKDPDPAPPAQWNFVGENFTLTLPSTTEFQVSADGAAVAVSQVGFKRRPLYAPLKKRDLRIDNSLYLVLAAPLKDGQAVTVKNGSGNLWNAANVSFAASVDPLRYSPALHVNQHGYMPKLSKVAFVGYYLGSLGEMALPSTSFQIVSAATRQPVFTGALTLRKDTGYTYTPAPYQQVYQADFTALTTPGEYVLCVPGVGASLPFLINEGAASAFTRNYALGLYHQRCGGQNVMPHTRHEHDFCHLAPASVPDMTYTTVNDFLAKMSSDYANNTNHTAPQLKTVDASLYPFVNKGQIDVSLGHHDAGDYSKYTINSAGLIHHLVFAADAFPNAGLLDNLGLPESGNGKSDLLEEAKWEADFLAKMQDADGGFYFLVYPRNRAYEDNVLPENGDPQVVFPKTTAATAAAVGALAEIASSPRFKQQFPLEASRYLAAAQKGWSFLTNAIARHGKNGAYQKITHYGNEFMHDDELAWAAAALFVATGEASYHQQLKSWYDPADSKTRRWSWWRLFEGYGAAARAYAFAARSGRLPTGLLDPIYLAKCEAEIVAAGDDIARFAEINAYGTSFPDLNKMYRSAGWYFSMERAFELATAQQISPKARYMTALVGNQNYEAGSNPVNVSYVTGLGWRRWRDIVHQYAQNDHRVLPPSGIPLGNIQAGFAYLENYKSELGKLCYPPDGATSAPYPFYERWGDSFNTTTEFVVVDQARSVASAAFLMAQSERVNTPSTNVLGQVLGLPQTIPAEQSVTATFTAPGLDVSQARVVWEALDQEPFIGQAFTFRPKNPGTQWVEVEATWADGSRAVARASFTASTSDNVAANSFLSAPLEPTSGMAALYHLDGSGADATAQSGSLALAGNAHYDAMNLAWMSSRAGQALRFYDLGDTAKATIPAAILARGTTNEIAIEAMVYINAYKGYGRGAPRLVSLIGNWNASLQLMEDTWSGAHVQGGYAFDVFGQTLSAALPLKKWTHISIRVNGSGYAFHADGKLIASVSSGELANWRNVGGALELGGFDGWVDELVVRTAPAPAPAPVNQLPTVQLLNPADGALFQSGAAIRLEASASDADGSVAKVEYSLNGAKLGEAAAAPYALELTGLAAGQHKISAVAVDDQGARGAPSEAAITVEAVNLPPTVALTQPLSGSKLIAPASITFAASVSDPDGQVAKVEFYNGQQKMAETTTAPHTVTLQGFTAGTYNFYAVAYDNKAASTVSAPCVVTIEASSVPASPAQFTATALSHSSIKLEWLDASSNESGFRVYRSTNAVNYALVHTLAAGTSTVTDSGRAANTAYYYLVSAYNASGESARQSASATTLDIPPTAPNSLAGSVQADHVSLTWKPGWYNKTYNVKRSTRSGGPYTTIATGLTSTSFKDYDIASNTAYYYVVSAVNTGGESANSSQITVRVKKVEASTAPASAYLGANTTRQGTWKGAIGLEGYQIIADAQQLPSYASVSWSGKADWTWEYSSDVRNLQRATESSRIAACSYTSSSMELALSFADTTPRKVALYFLDWDNAGRSQTVELLDGATGQFLHTSTLSNFANGVYLEYSVRGSVKFRFTKVAGPNAVVSGLFFDPAS